MIGTELLKAVSLSALVLVFITAPSIVLLPTNQAPATPEGLTPHDPISIDGNDDFTTANGVVAGSGTTDDPYIIENWAIDASSAHGIWIENTTKYFVIRNCLVENGRGSYCGIYLDKVINGEIENVTSENNFTSILFLLCENNIIVNCTIGNSNKDGIMFTWRCSGNTIANCTIKNNGANGVYAYAGIYLHGSNNNVSNCIFENNYRDGVSFHGSNNNVSNCIFENNNWGIHLSPVAPNNNVSNCIFENNKYGIVLDGSNNIIENCTVSGCSLDGISLGGSNNNISNCILENNRFGIPLVFSENNTITNCTVRSNELGIAFHSAENNFVSNCTLVNNGEGVSLWSSSCNNVFSSCTLENNGIGITLSLFSDNNCIYHNNFLNNENQAYDESFNYWDNGYPLGGNYWSDYAGVDNYQGENQNILGSDGIGDASYCIPKGTNTDRYPFINPIGWVPSRPPRPPWGLVIGIIVVVMVIAGITAAFYIRRMRL